MTNQNLNDLTHKANGYLTTLCREIPQRCVGSAGNREATTFFAEKMKAFGMEVETSVFDCFDWTDGGTELRAGEAIFEVKTGPYTLGVDVRATLCAADSLAVLKETDARGKILLLHGELTKEQLMPKNFPFYNPDHHRELVQLLETCGAAAILAATTRNPELAGGVYPFPLIEDGDFELPTAFMTDVEGERLLRHVGGEVSLTIRAQREPATGCNVTAGKPGSEDKDRWVAVCAHIDSKQGTPGALDNATGVTVLLLLAELLKEETVKSTIRITALNGEDYYSAPGQLRYLADNMDAFPSIKLAINLDGAGYFDGHTEISTYECPEAVNEIIGRTIAQYPGLEEGVQWYQGDHSIFIQNGVPAMAITSKGFMEILSAEITHTEKDVPEIVDCGKAAEIALALRDILIQL